MALLDQFETPPSIFNADGRERTVGVEIEFGSLGAEEAALVVQNVFGGRLVELNPNAYEVDETQVGDFAVKLDTRFAGYSDKSGGFLNEVKAELAKFFGAAASLVVPFEVVAPPVAIGRLPDMERLLSELRKAGASGTEANVFYAFGLQLNPEVPRLEARAVTAIVKAFALLSPWLWRVIEPDAMRRLLSFAEPYPPGYVRKLAAEDYWPDMPTLIDDYLAWNPTRNRDLDLLPLFAFVDETRVRRALPDEKINPRPTFHYRLPDMRLGDPKWGVACEWNRWVKVERLAADEARLADLCRAYLAHGDDGRDWAARIENLEFA